MNVKRSLILLLLLAMMPVAYCSGREVRRVSLLLSRGWRERPREVRLVKWFQTHPVLRQVKATVYGAATLPAIVRPCVLVQRESDGYCHFKASGDNVPETADALAEGICFKGRLIDRYVFYRRRVDHRENGPKREEVKEVKEEAPPVFVPRDVGALEVPDTVPPAKEVKPAEDDKTVAWPFLIFTPILAAGLTVAVKFRRLF